MAQNRLQCPGFELAKLQDQFHFSVIIMLFDNFQKGKPSDLLYNSGILLRKTLEAFCLKPNVSSCFFMQSPLIGESLNQFSLFEIRLTKRHLLVIFSFLIRKIKVEKVFFCSILKSLILFGSFAKYSKSLVAFQFRVLFSDDVSVNCCQYLCRCRK